MRLTLQSVLVATGSDEDGILVFADSQRLVAVLVRLSDDNEIAPGQWYLEAGFGRLQTRHAPTFANLDEARDWIGRCLREGQPP